MGWGQADQEDDGIIDDGIEMTDGEEDEEETEPIPKTRGCSRDLEWIEVCRFDTISEWDKSDL